jgi:hypothetical protein
MAGSTAEAVLPDFIYSIINAALSALLLFLLIENCELGGTKKSGFSLL